MSNLFGTSYLGLNSLASLPPKSMDLEKSSTQYLSMAGSDFGSYTLSKFAVSVWIKRESTGAMRILEHIDSSVSDEGFRLMFNGSNQIQFQGKIAGSTDSELITGSTFSSTSVWYHLLIHYDSANGTSTDRYKLYVDGVSQSFDAPDWPGAAVGDPSGADIAIGSTSTGSATFDGLMFQWALFDNQLPSAATIYNSGVPLTESAMLALSGIHSLATAKNGNIVKDSILATNWTNNNGVVASAVTP